MGILFVIHSLFLIRIDVEQEPIFPISWWLIGLWWVCEQKHLEYKLFQFLELLQQGTENM
jgi:hypothetical protein